MPISQSRYVAITSSVQGNGGVSTRSLNLRLITTNSLVPSGDVLTFSGQGAINDIEEYFGSTSQEYLRALMYFSWISKLGTQADSIDYVFWNNDAATDSLIFGKQKTFTLSTFTAITAGDLTITMLGLTKHITGVNLGAAGSLSVVAADLQTAVRAADASWNAATVVYNASPGNGGLPQFNLTSGAAGADEISVTAGVATDLASPLGWLTGAILSDGTAAVDIPTLLSNMVQNDNNFGSFVFVPTLSNGNVEAAAAWNAAQNNLYRYSVPVTSANAATLSAALIGVANLDLTLSPNANEYPEQIPATVEAATDYTLRNAVQNYMFQQNFSVSPTVLDDADANTYDALRVNYVGQTQNAGQLINFYQRGVMCGGTNVPTDCGIYANEQWLKSAMFAALMNLLLALSEVPANKTGKSQILAQIQSVINQAVFNGVVSVGKTLTSTQKLTVTQLTGDPNAWLQVQNQGYWVDCVIEPFVNSENNLTEYKAVYTLIYAKADAIRVIDGNDILI